MWKSLYLAALTVAILVIGFFTYYAWSWLESIGDPRVAWEAFNYHRGWAVWTLIPCTAVLIILGNTVLWSDRRAWALWSSHLFFTVFALLLFVCLRIVGTNFCSSNALCISPSAFLSVLLAVVGIIAVGAVVYMDQLLITRMYKRMYDERSAEEADPESENSRDEGPES